MEMISVISSYLTAIGYDPKTQKMRIQFNDGKTFEYSDVPVETWEEFSSASSVGKYFHSEIKNNFSATEV